MRRRGPLSEYYVATHTCAMRACGRFRGMWVDSGQAQPASPREAQRHPPTHQRQ